MRIIKSEIMETLRAYEQMTQTEVAGRISIKVNDHIDTIATLRMLEDAQVILFNAEQALMLVPAIRRFAEQLDFRLPFPAILFQFSEPIAETDLLAQEKEEADRILGMVVSQTETGINNAAVWFESTAVNRAQWENESVTPLRIDPRVIETEIDRDLLIMDHLTPADIKIRNKEIIRLLACALVAYINCENITLERQAVEEKKNRKRAAKGKRVLEPYYTVKIRGTQYERGERGETGRQVSFRFDVRGHFRRMENGKLTWVRPHQRGVQHEMYVPKVYQVD